MPLTEVWRGISADRKLELDLARLSNGDRLSPLRHRWWTTNRKIAEIYATTAMEGVPVLLRAVLDSDIDWSDGPPCLPALVKEDRLTLIEVIFL